KREKTILTKVFPALSGGVPRFKNAQRRCHRLSVSSSHKRHIFCKTEDCRGRNGNETREAAMAIDSQKLIALAPGRSPILTISTLTAWNNRIHRHPVTGSDLPHGRANFSHHARKLVSEDQRVCCLDFPFCRVEVSAAQPCQHHADDNIVVVQQSRLWPGTNRNRVAVSDQGLHLFRSHAAFAMQKG